MARGRLRSAVQRFGLLRAALYAVTRLLDRVGRGRLRLVIYRLVAQPVPDRPLIGRPGRVEVREIPPERIDAGQFPRPEEVIRWRCRQGYKCLGAFRDDRMIGFIWLALQGYDEDEVRCRFDPQPEDRCAWDFDIFVRPEHRIGTCFARLWQAANEYLRERGYRWTMSRISYFNVESLAAHRRLQAAELGTVAFLVAGPVQFTIATCRPWLHVAFSRGQRPRITLGEPG